MVRVLRPLLVTILLWHAASAFAAPELSDTFDASVFSNEELAEIQSALTFAGTYRGMWDGDWGPLSQSSLEMYAREKLEETSATNVAIVLAILEGLDEAEKIGWEEWNFEDLGVFFGIPDRLVTANPGFRDGVEFLGEQIEVRAYVHRSSSMRSAHAKLQNMLSGQPIYGFRKSERWVTSGTVSGLTQYIRSDLLKGRWITFEVVATGAAATPMAAITSSYRVGLKPPTAELAFARLLSLLEEAETAIADGKNEPIEDAERVTGGSGTGFFISNTLVLTNHHVVDRCDTLHDPNDRSFSIVAVDKKADLALLAFSGYSRSFLSISESQDVKLGEQISALGYPYFGLLSRQLTFTTGVVSAINGLADDPSAFTLTAPLQPGNSGGPIVDRSGLVVGVAVAVVDAVKVAEVSGSIPQNINFAIKSSVLREFLSAHDTVLASRPEPMDLSNGVPEKVQSAVTPIICAGSS